MLHSNLGLRPLPVYFWKFNDDGFSRTADRYQIMLSYTRDQKQNLACCRWSEINDEAVNPLKKVFKNLQNTHIIRVVGVVHKKQDIT